MLATCALFSGENAEVTDKKEEGAEASGDDSAESQARFYDKTKSFFDNISCEAVERQEG